MISLLEIYKQILKEDDAGGAFGIRMPKRDKMQELIKAGKYKFTDHALDQLRDRNITTQMALDAVANFQRVELSRSAHHGDKNRFYFIKNNIGVIAIAPSEPQHEDFIVFPTAINKELPDSNRPAHRINRPGMAAPGQGYAGYRRFK